MNHVEMSGFHRVSKTAARKAFVHNISVRIVPCKLIPDNDWIRHDVKPESNCEEYDGPRDNYNRQFESLCNTFKYYNCSYELGYYPAFYIKQEA